MTTEQEKKWREDFTSVFGADSSYFPDEFDCFTAAKRQDAERITELEANLVAMSATANNYLRDVNKLRAKLAEQEAAYTKHEDELSEAGENKVRLLDEVAELRAKLEVVETELLAIKIGFHGYDVKKLPNILISLSAKLFNNGGVFWDVTIDEMPRVVQELKDAYLSAQAKLDALDKQEPVGYYNPKRVFTCDDFGVICNQINKREGQVVPLYAKPVPATNALEEIK